MNNSRKNHPGVHWWSILNINPKNELFLFDSEGFEGFKVFILSDNKNIIGKVLYYVKQYGEKDKKVSVVTIEFSIPNYQSLKQSAINSLSTTAKDLFHLLSEFAYFKGHEKELKLVCVDDQLQESDSSTCRNFQLYFYKHLFDLPLQIKIINDTRLTKKTIETLLNDLFTLDQNKNEERVGKFSEMFDVKQIFISCSIL